MLADLTLTSTELTTLVVTLIVSLGGVISFLFRQYVAELKRQRNFYAKMAKLEPPENGEKTNDE